MELNYKSFGSGDPLIILHGLFGMLDNWQIIARQFSKTHEVFIIDLRNHGKSPHSDDFNYLLMARDIYEFIEEQNLFMINILGHSMGGKVAMQFAALYPGMVDKLIVADIFPKKYTQKRIEHELIFNAIQIINNAHFNSRKSAEDLIHITIKDKRVSMFLAKNLTYNDIGEVVWKFNANSIIANYNAILDNIRIVKPILNKTLFIKANESDYIDETEYFENYHNFPNSNLEIINDAGHWLHVDQPSEFINKVAGFLKS